MLWPLTVVLVANTNGRLAIPALAGLLVFHAKRHSNIPTGTPLTGASNAGVVGKNRDYELMPAVDAATGEVL